MPALVVISLLALNLGLILLPGLAVALRIARRKSLDPATAVMVVVVTSASVGYVAFWAYFGSKLLGQILSYATVLLSAGSLTRSLKQKPELRSFAKRIAPPFLYMLVVGVCYCCFFFLFSNPSKARVDLANVRFSTEVRPGDNMIPFFFGQRIYDRKPIRPFCCGGWLSSDRPPLQAGMFLLERPLRTFANTGLQYQLLGTVVQCFWICGVWCFLAKLRVGQHRIRQVLAFLIFSGFFFYNSVYVWPKLLAATFILFVPAILMDGLRENRPLTRFETLLSALSLSLALMAHPGSVFSLFAPCLLVAFRPKLITVRAVLLSSAILLGFVIPWRAYQKFYDPPGDRLLKMHLAAVGEPDQNTFWQDLREAYARMPAVAILNYKWRNLCTVVGPDPAAAFVPRASQTTRADQREYIWDAIGVVNFGWLAAIMLWLRRSRTRALPYAGLITAAVLVNFVVWSIVMFGPGQTFTTHGSYADIILLSIGLLGFLLTLRPLICIVLLALEIVNLFVVWVFFRPATVLTNAGAVAPRVQISLLILGFLCLAGLAVHLGRSFFIEDALHNQ